MAEGAPITEKSPAISWAPQAARLALTYYENGEYNAYLDGKHMRYADGAHFTWNGGYRLADAVLPVIRQDWDFAP